MLCVLLGTCQVSCKPAGLTGSWSSPGSGANFLWHNCCRLPSSDGTWMVVKGGMGTVTQQLGLAAQAAGVKIETGRQGAGCA